jgi:hypothetical protein
MRQLPFDSPMFSIVIPPIIAQKKFSQPLKRIIEQQVWSKSTIKLKEKNSLNSKKMLL